MSKPMLAGEGGDDLLARPLAEVSPDELQHLFVGAAKPDTQWFVGTEVEVFAFHREDLRAADHGAIRAVLLELGDKLDMRHVLEVNDELIGLEGRGEAVSLEPGGQLEFATRPHRSLKALRDEICSWASALAEVGAGHGLGFWAAGQQPFVTRDTAPVMPKPRYAIMREHLTGGLARDMMHLTGSVQVTVDFLDEANLTNKVRTAARASPFLSALVAASPFTAGRANGFKSRRYQIWLDTDAARCGLWPEMLDEEGLTAARYIARTLDTPAMFFRRDGKYIPADAKRTLRAYAADGFEGTTVTVADYLDHLTTFFPEIRPKGYVEMRGADCVPPAEAVAIAGFWRGILDDEATRLAVDERLASMDFAALRTLQPEVARAGLEAVSPAGPVAEVAQWLVQAAHGRLRTAAPDCAECLEPLLERAEAARAPADDLLERAEKSSVAEALELVEIR
jgi:glutamate--cysteine ligase